MRFIGDRDLRQWVQESLQRKLVQQAHELAVQTGCEVLVRFQDGRESPQCKYYVTDKMKHDYMNYGVRADPGDVPMSGESGLPKKYVHDFTCQVACEPTGPIPYTPDPNEHHEGEIIRVQQHHQVPQHDVHASEEWHKLYRDRLWTQATYLASKTKLESVINADVSRPCMNGQLPSVYPTTSLIQSEVHFPMESHAVSHESRDTALQNLKQLHLKRLLRHDAEQGERINNFPHLVNDHPIDDSECDQAIAFPQEHVEKRDEAVYISHQENSPLAAPLHPTPSDPRPPPSQPELQPRDTPELNVRATLSNGASYDHKTLSPVATQQRYLCRICERTFCDIYNLVSHAKMFHSSLSELVFACNSCHSFFEDARSLHDHLMTHGDLGFFAGAACQLKGRGKDRQNIVQQRRFPCPDCGKVFSRFGFMQSHIERVHGGTRIAASMDTTALSKDTTGTSQDSTASPIRPDTGSPLKEVLAAENSFENLYRCMDCERSFDRAESLQKHIKEVHLDLKTDSAPPATTEDVDTPVQRIRSKSEDVTFTGKEIYTCQECGKQFPRGKLLQNHVNTYHIPGDPSVASHRGEQPETRSAIVQPQQQSTNLVNSPVLVVKKETNQEILDLSTGNSTGFSSLTTSGDTSNMSSDYPGRSPGTPGIDEKHMEDQELSPGNDQVPGRRRYACDVCGKTYKYGFHMKEHRLTHAAVCPFVCRMCGMGFFRQRQLRDHELRHTGAYPCRCEICGKGFPRTSELKRHLAFRHSSHLDLFVKKKSARIRNEEQT